MIKVAPEKVVPPRHQKPNPNPTSRQDKKAANNLCLKLDRSYYSKGPKPKLNKRGKATRQEWLAIGPILDPCTCKNSPIRLENYFDPLSVEIANTEGSRTEQQSMGITCDISSEADDEA